MDDRARANNFSAHLMVDFFLSMLSFCRAARANELFFDKVESACSLP